MNDNSKTLGSPPSYTSGNGESSTVLPGSAVGNQNNPAQQPVQHVYQPLIQPPPQPQQAWGYPPHPPPGQQYPPPAAYPGYYPPAQPPPPQLQQQQQQQVVVIGGPQVAPVAYTAVQSFTGLIVLSCFVFWCCNPLFGLIAFILAMIAESTAVSDSNGARTLGRASLGMSISGIIISIVVIAIVVGVSVSSASRQISCTYRYNYNGGYSCY